MREYFRKRGSTFFRCLPAAVPPPRTYFRWVLAVLFSTIRDPRDILICAIPFCLFLAPYTPPPGGAGGRVEGKHNHEPNVQLDKQSNWRQSRGNKLNNCPNSISDCFAHRFAYGFVIVFNPLHGKTHPRLGTLAESPTGR